MSGEFEKDLASEVEAAPAAEATGPPIEELMAGTKAATRDLERDARAAAADLAIDSDPVEVEPDEPFAVSEVIGAESRRTDRVLQALLVLNVLLLAVMLMLPQSAGEGEQATGEPQPPDPFLQAPRANGINPDSPLWDQAVQAAGEGKYTKAVQLLETYLQTGAGIATLERGLVYNHLALYLSKDGRITESQEYSLKAQQLMARSYLPEDLLNGARRAEEQGSLTEMRSSYARFLLQLQQASPALRKLEAEAYLKLGDSYRLEAKRGAGDGDNQAQPESGDGAAKSDAGKQDRGHDE